MDFRYLLKIDGYIVNSISLDVFVKLIIILYNMSGR